MPTDGLQLIANWAQIISLPIAIISVLASIYFFRKGQQKSVLTLTYNHFSEPVKVLSDTGLADNIEIRFEDKPVENLFVFYATIANAGTEVISAEQVIKPLTLEFSEEAEFIRRPRVTIRNPDTMDADWSLIDHGESRATHAAKVEFDLLNPGDSFTTEFVCVGRLEVPHFSARIEGIPEVHAVDPVEIHYQQRLSDTARRILPFSLLFLASVGINVFASVIPTFGVEAKLYQRFAQGMFIGIALSLAITVVWFAFGSPLNDLIQHKSQMRKIGGLKNIRMYYKKK